MSVPQKRKAVDDLGAARKVHVTTHARLISPDASHERTFVARFVTGAPLTHNLNGTTVTFVPNTASVKCEQPLALKQKNFKGQCVATSNQQFAVVTIDASLVTQLLFRSCCGYKPHVLRENALIPQIAVYQFVIKMRHPWWVWRRSPHQQRVPVENERLKTLLDRYTYAHVKGDDRTVVDKTAVAFLEFLKTVMGETEAFQAPTNPFLVSDQINEYRNHLALCITLNFLVRHKTKIDVKLANVKSNKIELFVVANETTAMQRHLRDLLEHPPADDTDVIVLCNTTRPSCAPPTPALPFVRQKEVISEGKNGPVSKLENMEGYSNRLLVELLKHVRKHGFKVSLDEGATTKDRMFFYQPPSHERLLVDTYMGQKLNPMNMLRWLLDQAGEQFIQHYNVLSTKIKALLQTRVATYHASEGGLIQRLDPSSVFQQGVYIFSETSMQISKHGLKELTAEDTQVTREKDSVDASYEQIKQTLKLNGQRPPAELFNVFSGTLIKGPIIQYIRPEFRGIFIARFGSTTQTFEPAMWHYTTDITKMTCLFNIFILFGQYSLPDVQTEVHTFIAGPAGSGKSLSVILQFVVQGISHALVTDSNFCTQVLDERAKQGLETRLATMEDKSKFIGTTAVHLLKALGEVPLAVNRKCKSDGLVNPNGKSKVGVFLTTNDLCSISPTEASERKQFTTQIARRLALNLQAHAHQNIYKLNGFTGYTAICIRMYVQLLTSMLKTSKMDLINTKHRNTPVAYSRVTACKGLRMYGKKMSNLVSNSVLYILSMAYEHPEYMLDLSPLVRNLLDVLPATYIITETIAGRPDDLIKEIKLIFDNDQDISLGKGERLGCQNCRVNNQIRICKTPICPKCTVNGKVVHFSNCAIGYGKIFGGNESDLLSSMLTYFEDQKPCPAFRLP